MSSVVWTRALLVALVLAAYAAVLRADFITTWDDPLHVTHNARVTAPDGFQRSLRDGRNPGFYPVLFALYRAEWHAANQQPWLFHLDNVLLHAANAVLVDVLAGTLGLSPPAAALAAGLWALHPAHVESVAWITERKNVLYTFFWLGSLLVYLRGTGGLAYAASLLLFACSVLSKGAAMTLPAALVLVEWNRGRRLDRRFWISLVPYVAIAVLGGIGLLHLVPAGMQVPPLATRLGVAGRSFWFYVATFFWPHPLLPIYPQWPPGLDAPSVAAGAAAVALVGLAFGLRARVSRVILVGGALFATNVFPVLGVVWNSYHITSFVADRYLYLPAVGLAIAVVATVLELARATGVSARMVRAGLLVWIGALGGLTWRQVPVWRDSESLWTYTLARNPSCFNCHENLGMLSQRRGDLDTAARHLEAGLRLSPASPSAHHLLAVLLVEQRKLEQAVVEYRTAIQLALARAGLVHDLGMIINDLAGILLELRRTDEAIRVLEEGATRLPDAPLLPVSISWIRATSVDPRWRDGPQAVRFAEHACALTANRDLNALDALAAAYAEAGRFSEAVRTARQALAFSDAGSERAQDIGRRLALYEAGQPYRE